MKKELVAHRKPKSPTSEMFRTLRTNIQFMNSNKALKTLLVTSTLPEEGKSWVSANLAITFAQAGKKVLLVDADMRKGRQFNIFDLVPAPGLSNYLSGVVNGKTDENCQLARFVQETEVDNLFVITAGDVPPNPSELLVSEKMLSLIEQLKEIFDITIFDGTPSLLVADAPILSRIVDSTILVTAHNQTKIDNVEKVKKSIENIGGNIAGVVINKIPMSGKKYENSYYYGTTTLVKTKESKPYKENKKSRINAEKQIKEFESKSEEQNVEETNLKEEYTNYQSSEYNKPEVNYIADATAEKTQAILNKIKNYLDVEKGKLNNGDRND